MKETKKRISHAPSCWWYGTITLVSCLLLSGVIAAQDLPTGDSAPVPQLPAAFGVRLNQQFTPAHEGKTGNPPQTGVSPVAALRAASSETVTTPAGVHRLTLAAAQQMAAGVANPMVRLGQLGVEVARQNRLGAKATFFPQVGADFENLHFNKFMGQLVSVNRPLAGTTASVGLPLFGQNQTLLALTVTQPITPLFQINQLYKIAVADERTARAKAGMPVSETANNLEKGYYALLVAQRQLAFAKVDAKGAENKGLVASSSAVPVGSASHDVELIETSNALAMATTKVKELTAALNDMLGWPSDTELELVPPDPRYEDISVDQATEKALAANPEVIEAEGNVAKARAAVKLQKLTYVPVVAAMGGYAYNSNVVPLLPRDFSFLGIVATYNIFDFGKREHTIKGASAQAEMAELALTLTKAKVARAVKSSYQELERSKQLSELTRRLCSAIQVETVSYEGNGAEQQAAKEAKVEAEMFQADLDYREALAKLKTLMGEQ